MMKNLKIYLQAILNEIIAQLLVTLAPPHQVGGHVDLLTGGVGTLMSQNVVK